MGGINVPRWIGGGVVAALVIYLIEWFMAVKVWGAPVAARLNELGLAASMNSSAYLAYAVLCLLVGLVPGRGGLAGDHVRGVGFAAAGHADVQGLPGQ